MPESAAELIRSTEKPSCYLCGAEGLTLYANLPDRLFGAPGLWNLKQCPNSACGLIWLDPMPLPEDIGKAYANYSTHAAPGTNRSWRKLKDFLKQLEKPYQYMQKAYLARSLGYPSQDAYWQKIIGVVMSGTPWLRERFRREVAGLPYQAGGRLLDVGCGSGGFLRNMQRLGWNVEGVEVDPAAVAQARSQGLPVKYGTLEDQRYTDSTFDVITLFHVIEHLFEPIEVLFECRRLLKNGGQLILITPNTKSLGHKLFRECWRGLEPPRHLYLYSPSLLLRIAQMAGFSYCSIITTSSAAAFFYLASQGIARSNTQKAGFPYNLCTKLNAYVFAFFEKLQLRQNPDVGESIILKGSK